MVQPSIVVTPVPITSITSATSVAGFAVDNLLIDAPVAWRSTHATTHTFTARMAPEPIDTIALLQSNIPEDATVLIRRSEEHTSELQSLMRISYAVFCLKKK